jgi:cobalamin biosynthesis Co2+ chelatase CbiK
MTQQIDQLKRNISLHKSIEKQLCKRAFNSQKIIQELKQKAEKLEKEKHSIERMNNIPRKSHRKAKEDETSHQDPEEP